MKNSGDLIEVTDEEAVRRAHQLTSGLLDGGLHLLRREIRARGWVAVPIESAAHFDADDARKLTLAANALGLDCCLAVLTEPLTGVPRCLRVPLSEPGLLEFSSRCSHFEYILAPESGEFCVFCTVREFFVLAGPRAFVEAAAGVTLDEAQAAFERSARDPSWTHKTRSHLAEVLVHYADA